MSSDVRLPSKWAALLSAPYLRLVGAAGFGRGSQAEDYRHLGFEVGNRNFGNADFTEAEELKSRKLTADTLIAYTDAVIRRLDRERDVMRGVEEEGWWRCGRSEDELRWEALNHGYGRLRLAGWQGTGRGSPDYLWIEVWSVHQCPTEPRDRAALEGFVAARMRADRAGEEAELRLGRAALSALKELRASVKRHDDVLDGHTGLEPMSPTGDDYNEVVGMVNLAAAALDG